MLKENQLREWIIVEGPRETVAAGFGLFFFLSMLIFGILDLTSLRQIMTMKDPVETLFYGYLTSLITGVTLVVTINQLVLSQELGPLGDQRERMEGSMNVREDAEELIGSISSKNPSEFMSQLLETAYENARHFQQHPAGSEISDQIQSIADESHKVSASIGDKQFGSFDLIGEALNYNYSKKLYTVRKIKKENEFDGEQQQALEQLQKTLSMFGPVREHLKTLYFQWSLINLSRRIIYVAVPAILVTSAIVLFMDGNSFPGTFLGVDNLIWITSLASTIAVTPFLLLASYILRIGTIAKRTLAIGPFVLQND